MTNDKFFLTLNWQDQNCHPSSLLVTDFYHFLVNAEDKRP